MALEPYRRCRCYDEKSTFIVGEKEYIGYTAATKAEVELRELRKQKKVEKNSEEKENKV